MKLIVTAGGAVGLYWAAFHWLQQFGSCSVQLDPDNQLWIHIRHAQWCWPLESMCSCFSCVHVRVCFFTFSSFPEAILNYVSVRSLSPLYFLYCAVRLDSVSNSPHAGTLCTLCSDLYPSITSPWLLENAGFMLASGFKISFFFCFPFLQKPAEICLDPASIINQKLYGVQ